MNRRLFCQSLAMTLATLGSSRHLSPLAGSMQTTSGQSDRLAQVLGLEGAETAWLRDLSTREHGALLAALTSGAAPTPATISLIY